MIDPFDNLADDINSFLIQMGINPIYLGTCILYIYIFMKRKKIKNWKDLEREEKRSIILAIYIALIFTFASFVFLFKIKN